MVGKLVRVRVLMKGRKMRGFGNFGWREKKNRREF